MSFAMPPPRPKKPAKPALTISPVNSRPGTANSNGSNAESEANQPDDRTERLPRGVPPYQASSNRAHEQDSETLRMHQIQKVLAGVKVDDSASSTPYLGSDGPSGSRSSSASLSYRLRDQHDSNSGSITSASEGSTPLMARSGSSSSSLAGIAAPNSSVTAASATSSSSSFTEEDISKITPGDLQDVSRLGEGSAGEVYKVLHKPTGLYMAKKTMATSPQPEIHRQILRELAFNRECRAPFIVNYYGAYLEESEHQIAILMEYCQGGSLDAIYKQIKKRGGRTGEKILGKVAEAVLNGLVYLHDRKIIHRDIKPSNICVSKDGHIKLCDFGVSGELINSLAKTFVGTSYYMAPERIQGAPYSWTSDIWSLGLTLYEIAMNRFPFPAEGEPPLGPIDLLTYIIRMEPPQLKDDEDAGIVYRKPIKDFLRLCLIKDAKQRPTPDELRSHPWVLKSAGREVDTARWLRQVWGWPDEGANQ